MDSCSSPPPQEMLRASVATVFHMVLEQGVSIFTSTLPPLILEKLPLTAISANHLDEDMPQWKLDRRGKFPSKSSYHYTTTSIEQTTWGSVWNSKA